MPGKKSIAVTIFAVVLSLAFFSCKDSPTGPSEDALVGKWILKNINMHMQIKAEGMQITKDTSVVIPTNDMYLDLRADNTFSFMFDPTEYVGGDEEESLFKKFQEEPIADEGTWSLSGSNLSLIDSDTTITLPITLKGNDLTATMKVDMAMDETMSIKVDMAMGFKR